MKPEDLACLSASSLPSQVPEGGCVWPDVVSDYGMGFSSDLALLLRGISLGSGPPGAGSLCQGGNSFTKGFLNLHFWA